VVLPEAFPREIRQWVSPEALLDRQSRGGLAGKDPATREAWSQRVTSPAGRQGIGRYSGALRGVTVRPAVPYCFHEYDGPGATMMLDTTTLRAAFGVITLTLLVLFYLVTFRHTRSEYSAWWCTALGLFLFGAASFLLDGTSQQVWANPLGNTLLVAGAASVWSAARSLRTSRPLWWQLTLAPATTAVASALDHPATNDWSGGPVFLALMSLMIGLAARELWLLKPDDSRVDRPLAVMSGLLAAYYFGRLLVFLAEGPTGPVFLTYFGSAPTTLVTMALLVVVSFSMAVLSHEQLTKDLSARATRDGLTGVLNRTTFLNLAAGNVRRLRFTRASASLVLADLDHFKAVNDSYGHPAGDSVLQAFAAACLASVRSTDLVGTYGGEEFIIFLPGAGPDRAEAIAGEISRRFAAVEIPENVRFPTVSYGIATNNSGAADLRMMISSADSALYRAKSTGRNRAARNHLN
jgi:diguanylate cyclase (GGDEF)-like protein